MRLDRVADDIYVFVSDLYIQVVSTVLLTDDGAVVVDTLAFPSETREVLAFIEGKLGTNAVRYVVNTHHHADHVYGNYLFESADVVAHERTRDLLQRYGPARLAQARRETPALAHVHLRPPISRMRKRCISTWAIGSCGSSMRRGTRPMARVCW